MIPVTCPWAFRIWKVPPHSDPLAQGERERGWTTSGKVSEAMVRLGGGAPGRAGACLRRGYLDQYERAIQARRRCAACRAGCLRRGYLGKEASGCGAASRLRGARLGSWPMPRGACATRRGQAAFSAGALTGARASGGRYSDKAPSMAVLRSGLVRYSVDARRPGSSCGVAVHGMRGQRHDRHLRPQRPDRAGGLLAVHFRHRDVHEDQVGLEALEQVHRDAAVVGEAPAQGPCRAPSSGTPAGWCGCPRRPGRASAAEVGRGNRRGRLRATGADAGRGGQALQVAVEVGPQHRLLQDRPRSPMPARLPTRWGWRLSKHHRQRMCPGDADQACMKRGPRPFPAWHDR
jgi:hypothetical protein